MVSDMLKAEIASVADLLDRQLVLLCSPETSDGLPANLVASEDVAHHGFKAMQISASALTAEALKLTMPASDLAAARNPTIRTRVSMGTIAARDCLRVVELGETVAAVCLLAACQAVDLRGVDSCGVRARQLHTLCASTSPWSTKTDARRRHPEGPTVVAFRRSPHRRPGVTPTDDNHKQRGWPRLRREFSLRPGPPFRHSGSLLRHRRCRESSQPSTLEELMQTMASTPGVVAEFVETKRIELLDQPS